MNENTRSNAPENTPTTAPEAMSDEQMEGAAGGMWIQHRVCPVCGEVNHSCFYENYVNEMEQEERRRNSRW